MHFWCHGIERLLCVDDSRAQKLAGQMKTKQAKWWRWLGVTAPDGSKIGAYAGGDYYDSGYYRPSQDSNMRTLGKPLNQPSAENLVKSFYGIVHPVDTSTPAAGDAIHSPRVVTITTPRLTGPDFLIHWGVDGESITRGYGSRSLDLAKVALTKGKWNALTVTVRDTTAKVRDEAFRTRRRPRPCPGGSGAAEPRAAASGSAMSARRGHPGIRTSGPARTSRHSDIRPGAARTRR